MKHSTVDDHLQEQLALYALGALGQHEARAESRARTWAARVWVRRDRSHAKRHDAGRRSHLPDHRALRFDASHVRTKRAFLVRGVRRERRTRGCAHHGVDARRDEIVRALVEQGMHEVLP